MSKLKENRECPYCDEYIMNTRDHDVHYSHTKRHTKQYFHYSCWRSEMDKRISDHERIKRNNEERAKRMIEHFANRKKDEYND